MSDGESDVDLRRAIALSLEETHPPQTAVSTCEVIELSDGEEHDKEEPESSIEFRETTARTLISDRKQMELDRLARAEARAQSNAAASGSGQVKQHSKRGHLDSDFNMPFKRHQRRSISPPYHTRLPQPSHPIQPQASSIAGLQYPDGVVKKTWAFGYERTSDDIKIEEVLQKNTLDVAVLSAFQWDDEWILNKLNLTRTRVICVVQAADEKTKQLMNSNKPATGLKFCFPSMAGNINCMHSKLMILAHPGYVRIVVPSANLVPYDWGESGVMENIVFIVDLPKIIDNEKPAATSQTPFQRELLYFLKAQDMDSGVINSLSGYDFSRTAHLAFVHSCGGLNAGNSWKRTGYCGLGTAIKELGLATSDPVEIDFVTSSIGSLTNTMIECLYLAAKGDNGMTELAWRSNRPAKSKAAIIAPSVCRDEQILVAESRNRFRIYFPTHETLSLSRGGVESGGTICFQPQWFDSPTFPRGLLRDCKSIRNGLLMHSKMIFCRLTKPIPRQITEVIRYEKQIGNNPLEYTIAWAYVGSANISESAWGRLVQDRDTKMPKLNLRNWECGVIIPIWAEQPQRHMPGLDVVVDKDVPAPSMDVFSGIVPVPMAAPGEDYGSRRPWFRNQR